MQLLFKRFTCSILVLITVLSSIMIISPLSCYSQSIRYDYGSYRIYFDPDNAEIISCNGDVTSLTLPEALGGIPVREISYYAFSSMDYLNTITLPSTVTKIDYQAFGSCPSISAIYVNAANTLYKSVDGDLFSKDGTILYKYAPGKQNSHYNLSAGVISIANSALRESVNLKTISLPSSLTTISDLAFYDCSLLESVTIPNSVTTIGYSAFENCTSLKNVSLPSKLTKIDSCTFADCVSLSGIAFPVTMQKINNGAFENCDSLTNVSIPLNVDFISSSAFCDCSNLATITVNPQNKYYKSVDNVMYSKDNKALYLYPAKKTGETYIIPSTVTAIYNYTFSNNPYLLYIDIPESVDYVFGDVFYDCPMLSTVVIKGNQSISISKYAVEKCPNLVYKTLKDSLPSANLDENLIPHIYYESSWQNHFNDLNSEAWFYNPVKYCFSNNYMSGTSVVKFSPDTKLTRAMFSLILAKVAGANLNTMNGSTPFTDVPSTSWFAKGVQWASTNGLATGVSASSFNPNGNITRQEIALMMFNFARMKGDNPASDYSALVGYNDTNAIAAWAKNAVSWAIKSGLISGTTATTISPSSYATRGQAATIIKGYVS